MQLVFLVLLLLLLSSSVALCAVALSLLPCSHCSPLLSLRLPILTVPPSDNVFPHSRGFLPPFRRTPPAGLLLLAWPPLLLSWFTSPKLRAPTLLAPPLLPRFPRPPPLRHHPTSPTLIPPVSPSRPLIEHLMEIP